ncbi:helix-turn-helix domain-containing protein [Acidaminobacter sp. JC074]|uniref:helix-turn-helix domain-containing protein n=1 Tax=Acidaminobacter sp. JC074 TaxID=2530199 RepID=UPI001F10AE18|nr:helix-turn-helix domain-containing protein [Acidaminobacter sp. JC074]MCH4890119.1 helix-turn-helix domain-containing protein [Acidaminobacter sp. JC074]
MKDLLKKIDFFWLSSGIPVKVYKDKKLIHSKNTKSQTPVDKKEHASDIEKLLDSDDFITFLTSKYGEHYFAVNHDTLQVVCGPTVSYAYEEQTVVNLLEGRELSHSIIKAYERYFNALPIYAPNRLTKSLPLVIFLLTGLYYDISNLMKVEVDLEDEKSFIQNTSSHHHSMEKTYQIIEAIKNGDTEGMKKILISPDDGPTGILSKNDPLRSYKNLFMTSVSEANNAAVSGGLDSETAFTLSDAFILKADSCKSHEEVTEIYIQMFLTFTEMVQKAKKIKYSKPVYMSIDYIHKHYREKIKISDLSEHVHISESHLLNLFKSQLQMSIKDYIIYTRIEEAKKLLKYTNHSLSDICSMVSFNDQSHFSRTFKKWTSTTPKYYRDFN